MLEHFAQVCVKSEKLNCEILKTIRVIGYLFKYTKPYLSTVYFIRIL